MKVCDVPADFPTEYQYSTVQGKRDIGESNEETEYDVTSHVKSRELGDTVYSYSHALEDIYDKSNHDKCQQGNEGYYDHVGVFHTESRETNYDM